MKLFYSLLLAMLCSFIATDAHAQLITWEPSVNMFQGDATDESFVSTNGTLVEAVNGGSPTDATVNGVLFTAMPGSGIDINGDPQTADGQVTTSAGGFITVNDSQTNPDAFGGQTGGEFLGMPIADVIAGGLWACDSVTLNNLTPGNTYEIQIFNNDARNNRTFNFIAGYGAGDGMGAAGFLELNNSIVGSNDGSVTFPETNVGDFLIGTFTASSTSLTFECFGATNGDTTTVTMGDSRGQINGLQLRDISMVMDIIGDVNCDGVVSFLDIAPFIDLLANNGFSTKADINGDGIVSFLDIGPFIDILSGG